MAMVRKISCKTLLTLENAFRSFQLGYRTKINKEVPLLERFVTKVNYLYLSFQKLNVNNLLCPVNFIVGLNFIN